MRCPASTSCLERHSCPADRCPNSSSLYPPLAAVVAVALFSRFSDLKAPQPLRRQLPAGERVPAGERGPADAVCSYDPSREKANKPALQGWLVCFFTGRVVTADGICWPPLPCWHPLPCGELPPQRLRGLQIGEARKKCNGDDRRQRRIQGGAVGAAVSRTRVPLKARSGRWAPQPV